MSEIKTERIVKELMAEIAAGNFGNRGDIFPTTRDLCKQKNVSLKTAFRILNRLKDEGLLERSGRCHRILSLMPAAHAEERPLLIGFLATCLESPYFAKLACHAEEFAHSVGASLIIASSNYDFDTEQERLKMFCRQGVAGILICPWASSPEQEACYATLPVPYVMLGRKLESLSCASVLVNNQKAAQSMARHLIEQGLTDFAYIGQSGKQHDQRLFGFRAELNAAGFQLPENNIIRTDYNQTDSCRKDILKLLRRKRSGRLGIFCYHDLFATRVLNLCHEHGIAVPETIAVAGFDDLPAAAETYPSLTSVSYPVRDMAHLAFESLYAQIKFGMKTEVCRYLDSRLVIRDSTVLKRK